ncbi:MAG: 3'-5' exoribonuclease YhaM family protein, partial [Gemmatimonadota bacterium]
MGEMNYRKSMWCSTLIVGDKVDEVFSVSRVELRQGKNGPFLRLEFADRTGRLPGVAWNDADRLAERLVEGGFARVRGDVGEYQGERQLRVQSAEFAHEALDPADFLASGPVPGEVSVAAIRALLDTLADVDLRRLVSGFLDDPDFSRSFAAAPAAKVNHHAYVGGLAEHTLSVMELCALVASHYPELDRDLLLAGAFCHDIGKVVELAVEPGFPYTEEGTLLGHIALGFAMVRARCQTLPGCRTERITDLGHLILSHQGELEWGSPVQPQTMEALVLHFLDNLDSKVATARTHLDATGGRAYVRALGRALFRRPGGGAAPEAAPVAVSTPAEPAGPTPPAATGGGPDALPGPSLFDKL